MADGAFMPDATIVIRVLLAGAFAAALIAKLTANQPLARTIARGLRVNRRTAEALAAITVAAEIAIAAGLLIPPAASGAALLALLWVAGAAVFWAVALPSDVESCGCLGSFDPLKRLGPARRFAYLGPYAAFSALLVADQIASAKYASPLIIPVFAAALAVVWVISSSWPTPTGDLTETPGIGLTRRRFMFRIAALAVAVFLARLAAPSTLLADTCGYWKCHRIVSLCACPSCSNNQSRWGCYAYACRTCYGPYGSYQQCTYQQMYVQCGNTCTGCGSGYVSNCRTCWQIA